jgi:hypothetical protein
MGQCLYRSDKVFTHAAEGFIHLEQLLDLAGLVREIHFCSRKSGYTWRIAFSPSHHPPSL